MEEFVEKYTFQDKNQTEIGGSTKYIFLDLATKFFSLISLVSEQVLDTHEAKMLDCFFMLENDCFMILLIIFFCQSKWHMH